MNNITEFTHITSHWQEHNKISLHSHAENSSHVLLENEGEGGSFYILVEDIPKLMEKLSEVCIAERKLKIGY